MGKSTIFTFYQVINVNFLTQLTLRLILPGQGDRRMKLSVWVEGWFHQLPLTLRVDMNHAHEPEKHNVSASSKTPLFVGRQCAHYIVTALPPVPDLYS